MAPFLLVTKSSPPSGGAQKNMKRKQGFMEKKGKKRTFTCQVCYKAGHTKKSFPNRPTTGGPAPWGQQPQKAGITIKLSCLNKWNYRNTDSVFLIFISIKI